MKFKSNGKSIKLTGQKQASLLLLMCRSDVRMDDLIDALWPGWTPRACNPKHHVMVVLTQLRVKLKPLGWTIAHPYSMGRYYLKRTD